jgi:hypothetical protein
MKELKQRNAAAQARMPKEIVEAHKHCKKHRTEIFKSQTCACFYCLQSFAPAEIVEWTDKNKTALCPKCGIDSVLGSAAGFPLTAEFLGEMNKHWF